METRQEVRDYIIEHIISQETLRQLYPDIKFNKLTSRISHIEVPLGKEADLENLQKGAVAVFTPILFGLNISEALENVNISTFHENILVELTGKETLIGFIDTGIQYTNNLFLYEDYTTRIQEIWDQTIDGNPPSNYYQDSYDFGSVYTKEDINRALLAEDPLVIVPSTDTNGHGTYLAGIAAGKDRIGDTGYIGGAPDAKLVVVKLREAKTYVKEFNFLAEDTIAYQANDVMEGINYLFQVAVSLNMPIAICIALGSNDGPHNGLTIIERFLNDRAGIYDAIIISSAGNEGDLSHHYSNSIKQGERQELEINVAEGEKGFELSLWARGADKISVGFRTPLGNGINEVPIIFVNSQEFSFNLEKSQVVLDYDFPNLISGSQSIRMRFINPTSGIWTIYLYGNFVISEEYDLWLPREGFIKGETKFLKPDPMTTVCIPSTAEQVIVVGSYSLLSQGVYPSSGRGPTTNLRIKPDIVAPGVNVSGPDLTGGYTTKTGTGAAAAVTTSACSLLLQWAIVEGNFNIINTNIARTILIRGARRNQGTQYPNSIEGYGRLDLKSSIELI